MSGILIGKERSQLLIQRRGGGPLLDTDLEWTIQALTKTLQLPLGLKARRTRLPQRSHQVQAYPLKSLELHPKRN